MPTCSSARHAFGGIAILAIVTMTTDTAHAQPSSLGQTLQNSVERVGPNHWRYVGNVEIDTGDFTLLANEVDFFTDTGELHAVGNVVLTEGPQRIAADRVEFNVATNTGSFYNANGMLSLGETAELALFGTSDPAVLFYGERVDKLAPDQFRITNGAFTTCLQPTPRWELATGTLVFNRDRYAMLRNTLLKVKGVPVFYLPILYYPINDEDRSTGFLIPQYGVSTIRGQSIGNAFFWALGRSQDATFYHDWYTQTGHGLGAEYRYLLSRASRGEIAAYFLNEHPTTLEGLDGSTTDVPGRRSFQIRGDARQRFGAGMRATGRVDYFSDITVQQTYNTNIYQATQRSRLFTGSLRKDWDSYSLAGSYERSETFYGTTSSALTGDGPNVNFSVAETPIGGSRVYYSLDTDYANVLRRGRSGSTVRDRSLHRLDVWPVLRVPFTALPYLTVNSTASWRNTHWTESLDDFGVQVDKGISRQYFDFSSEIVGPVFNKIWDTPDSGYAERFKHTIEPFLELRRVTAIDEFDRIVRLESVDSIVGSTTETTYGLNNRIFARRVEGGSSTAASREILTVSVNQTYYTDASAAEFDEFYRSSFSGAPPSHFSPVAIQARIEPTLETFGNFRAELDGRHLAFRSLGADATVSRGWLQVTAGWSQRRFIEGLPGFDDPDDLDHYLNQTTSFRTPSGRVSGAYTFNYDVRLRSLLQQRLLLTYHAQCCGLIFEYQSFDFSGLGNRVDALQDRRFNFSFVLAGLGSFSNFFGAMNQEDF